MTSAISRREFVGVGGCALACVAVGGCASLVSHQVTAVNGGITVELADYPELREPGGAITLQPGGMADPIYVLAAGDGEFRALSPICTHRGCTVDVEGPRLVCPCHGSTYDRNGAVLKGPAERPLTRFDVRRTGRDTLTIDLRSAP